MSIFEHLIVKYRWIFVCCFLLPASVIYDALFYVRNWFVFRLSSAPKQHEAKVADVQKQVLDWKASGSQTLMCTGRPGWATVSFRRGKYKHVMTRININMVDILSVDLTRRIVKVEPLVTMGQLTATLNPLGWTLPVLPELDDLTVGGLIMGCGVETSSHKYGLFHETCVAYELVLADGRAVRCSEEENPDLFHAIPWSHGTLGFLVAAEIQIVPATKYVELKYTPIHSRSSLITMFTEAASRSEEHEFVECLVYGPERGVIMTGTLVNEAADSKAVNKIGRFWKPWFFKHVENILDSREDCVEYIPLRDYYHRHTRSLFWELQDIIPFGNNAAFRFLFGWMVPPKISFLKLTQTKAIRRLYEKYHIIQDMIVPLSNVGEALEVFDKELDLYPLWLCPAKLYHKPGFVHPVEERDVMYFDLGAYGPPKAKSYQAQETTKRIERYVRSVHGFQMLYADTYMNESEFREMFDHNLYDRLRKELNCATVFPDVFGKVNKNVRE